MVTRGALSRWRRALPYVVRTSALAAGYFVTGHLGLLVGAVGGFAAPVWPPSGIAIVALLLLGRRVWPGVAVGAFALNLLHGAPVAAALAIGAGNTLEAVVAIEVLRRARFEPSLARPRDVVALLLAALASTPISASIGTLALVASGAAPSSAAVVLWTSWFVGDLLSDLVVAPLLLLLLARELTRTASRLESALAFGCVLAASIAFIAEALPPALNPIFGRAYLIYPVLLWPSMRIGPRGSAIAMAIVSVIAIGATRMNRGAFATDDHLTALMALQVFIGVVALTQLLLASAVAESRLRDKLMSIASHELRGPIWTLGMALEVVREAPTPRVIDSAQRQVRRLSALVQELLEATRVGAPLHTSPEPMDLAELASEVLSRLEPELRAVKSELTLRTEPCRGSWDPLRMDQLITNLVSNAARHAPGTPIAVAVEDLGDRVRLRVADQGPGIARGDRARIFDAYQALARSGPGLGLGLHIAREIVIAHGGTLTVESELGCGATFIAELPRRPAPHPSRGWRLRAARRAPRPERSPRHA